MEGRILGKGSDEDSPHYVVVILTRFRKDTVIAQSILAKRGTRGQVGVEARKVGGPEGNSSSVQGQKQEEGGGMGGRGGETARKPGSRWGMRGPHQIRSGSLRTPGMRCRQVSQ